MKVLGLESDERGIILGELEDPPEGLAELRAVLLNEDQWRRREGLDAVSSRLRREERSVVAGRLIHGPKLTIGARRALRGDLRPFAVCRRAPR